MKVNLTHHEILSLSSIVSHVAEDLEDILAGLNAAGKYIEAAQLQSSIALGGIPVLAKLDEQFGPGVMALPKDGISWSG